MAHVATHLIVRQRWFYPAIKAAAFAVAWLAMPVLSEGERDRLLHWLADIVVRVGIVVEVR